MPIYTRTKLIKEEYGVGRPTKSIPKMTKLEQREASVEKLFSAARQFFVLKGYNSTTLEEIATAVGMTKGSIYFYFGSKEAVLIELLNRAEKIVIEPVLELISNSSKSASDRIVSFLHHQALLSVTERENMLLIILMSLEFDDGAVRKKIKSLYRKLYDGLDAVVRSGQEAGEFRTDAPSREIVSIIIANHDGTLLEWYRRNDELDGAKLVKAMRDIIIFGLKKE